MSRRLIDEAREEADNKRFNMNLLEDLSKHHNEWVTVCEKYLPNDAEDIVQDMYLKLNGKNITYGDDINKYFIYRTLTNMCLDRLRKGKNFVDIDNIHLTNEESDYEEALDTLFQKIDEITGGWSNFEKRLFDLYMYSGLSFRSIAFGTEKDSSHVKDVSEHSIKNGSKISVRTLFHSIKESKEEIRRKMWEDYIDFKNGEYHLL